MIDWDYFYYLADSSPEHYETLLLLARGMSVKEISSFRGVTTHHVWNTMDILRKKSGAKNTRHLIHIATKIGIL